MAGETEEIITRIGISGQDEVIAALRQIAEAAEESGKRMAASFGGEGALKIAAFGTALTGAAVGFGVWIEHANDAGAALQRFADATGQSAGDISALESAIVSMGGSLDGIQSAFRRLASVAGRVWDEIKKQARDARDTQISDALAVQEANENLFKARQTFAERERALGRETGIVAPTAFQQRIEAQREAQTAYDKAVQASHEAQKKADIDRLNDINNVAAAIERVVKGEQTFADASKTANLEASKAFEGLVAGATPGAIENLKNVSTNMNELAGMSPKVQELFLNLAELMKRSGSETFNNELALRAFGRTMGSQLIPIMQEGRGELEKNINQAKQFGLSLGEDATKSAEQFHRAYSTLTGDLATTTTQIGIAFGPAFTEGFKTWNKFFEENHVALQKWVNELAKSAAPAIQSFFDSVTGLAAAITGGKLEPGSAPDKWKEKWQPVVDLFGKLIEKIEWINDHADIGKLGLAALNKTRGAVGLAPLEAPPEEKPTEAKPPPTTAPPHSVTVPTTPGGITIPEGQFGRGAFRTLPETAVGTAPPLSVTAPAASPPSSAATPPIPVEIKKDDTAPPAAPAPTTAPSTTSQGILSPTLGGLIAGGGLGLALSGGNPLAALIGAGIGAYEGPQMAQFLSAKTEGQPPPQQLTAQGPSAAEQPLIAALNQLTSVETQRSQQTQQQAQPTAGPATFDERFSAALQQQTTNLSTIIDSITSALSSLVSAISTAASQVSGAGEQRWLGGIVGYQGGGKVIHPPSPVHPNVVHGPAGRDAVPIMATRGEGIVTVDAMDHYGGASFIDSINQKILPTFNAGGIVQMFNQSIMPHYATGGYVQSVANGGGGGRPIELHIGEERIALTGTDRAADQISRVATERAVRSGYGGNKSSWYRGS